MTRKSLTPLLPPTWRNALIRPEIRLLVIAVGVLAAVWVFLALTGEVRENETNAFDRTVLLAFRLPGDLVTPVGPRWLQETSRDITAFGGFTGLSMIVVLAVTLLLLQGRRTQALVFGGAVIFGQLAADVAKLVVGRTRPDLVPHLDMVYSSSFPSGHATMSPVVYLTLAAIISVGHRRRSVKVVLLMAAIILVIAIGVSRVYLGVHWPTDVLAGWTMGSAIALAATFLLHIKAATRGNPTGQIRGLTRNVV